MGGRETPALDLIPAALFGTSGRVGRAWSNLTAQAVEARSWTQVVRDVPMVSIHQTSGKIILQGPSRSLRGDHFQCYEVMRQLVAKAYLGPDRTAESNEVRRLLLLDGSSNPLVFALTPGEFRTLVDPR